MSEGVVLDTDWAVFAHRLPTPGEGRPLELFTAYGRYEVVAHPLVADYNDAMLLHLAVLAELRLTLGVAAWRWTVLQDEAVDYAGGKPDAVYVPAANALCAAEVDLGFYSLERVRKKLKAFTRYQNSVWGVISSRRAAYLQRVASELGLPPPQVMVLPLPGKSLLTAQAV